MKSVNELKAEISKLWASFDRFSSNADEILAKVKELEKQIKDTRIIDTLNRVNREQQRKRELALLAWNAEQPTEDITTNSGTFHATKVKKYPNLAALPYCTAEVDNGKIIELRINGERFNMFKREYKKYTRPDTFEEFLRLNLITEKDIQLTEFLELIEKSEAINKEFKEATEKFSKQKEELKLSFFNNINLFEYRNVAHIYQYEPNLY